MPRSEKWVKFYSPDGKCLGGYTVKGTFSGELKATIELLAAENGLETKDIIVKREGL